MTQNYFLPEARGKSNYIWNVLLPSSATQSHTFQAYLCREVLLFPQVLYKFCVFDIFAKTMSCILVSDAFLLHIIL